MASTPQMSDTELKQRHRAMWASGDYPSIALIVAPVSVRMVQACGIEKGMRVLDVAAGTGSSAIPAAALGADVVASDLTPELFEDGRARAREEGVELEWIEADAEVLPFADGEFDVVMSALGAMFAPRHEVVAREMLRVVKPGGTVGLANWTPEGMIGEMFRVMRPFMPAPPPGAQPPPLWGSEDHVRELFGDGLSDLAMERHELEVAEFATPAEYRDAFKTKYGPTIAAYKNAAGEPGKAEELDRALLRHAEERNLGGNGPGLWRWEYLVATGRRSDTPA